MSEKKVPGRQGKNSSGRTTRDGSVRLKTARGRKTSSTRWLERQLNDPYVREANRLGYRSRALFKLKEIDEKLKLVKPGMSIIDLGAAPGGWSEYVVSKGATKVIGIDLLEIEEVPGAKFLKMDFTDDDAEEILIKELDGRADLVLSDMAANTMGHKQTDHIRIMALVEMAYYFAIQVLKKDGVFLAKVFQGGAQSDLLTIMKKDFKTVRHVKPKASRKDSAEQYVVASGFRGLQD